MATKRTAISKKKRFEVFKRDGFKCQYCGAEAPKVVLHVDHISPVSKGGGNDLLNLVTSCVDCNSGKSDRKLSDDSAVSKQRAQLAYLHARREQMEMMLLWRDAIKNIDDDAISVVQKHFTASIPGWHIKSDSAVKTARKYLKKYGLEKVLDAIDVAVDRYVVQDMDGVAEKDSVNDAWNKVGGILHICSKTPDQQRLHYVVGILRKRLNYVPYTAMNEMEDGLDAGIDVEDMVQEAKRTRNWSSFSYWLSHEEA